MANKYFSITGDDSTGDGSASNPWKLPPGQKGESHGWTPSAGDTIYLKRGDTWDLHANSGVGALDFDWVGTAASPITYTSYYNSDGSDDVAKEKPHLYGLYETIGLSWTSEASNIYKATLGMSTTVDIKRCFFDDIGKKIASGSGTVSESTPWYHDAAADILYVYTPSNDPTADYNSILVPAAQSSYSGLLYFVNISGNIIVNNLKLTGGIWYGATVVATSTTSMSNITINNCDFYSHGISGVFARGNTDNASISGLKVLNSIFNSKRNADENLGSDAHNGPAADGVTVKDNITNTLIENCTFTDYIHDGVNFSNNNYPTRINKNSIVRNCRFIVDQCDYMRAIGVAESTEDAVSNIYFYNNYIYKQMVRSRLDATNVYFHNNIFVKSSWNGLIPDNRGESVRVYKTTTTYPKYIYIYNNIFINGTDPAILLEVNNANMPENTVYIYNNILLNNDTDNGYQIFLSEISAHNIGNQTISNNLLYKSGITNLIDNDGVSESISTYEASNSNANNNISVDPILDDSYFPSSISPCLDAGMAPLSKFDAYSRPNYGNHIGAVWPRINTSKIRRNV
jgi:hypothetical protein